MAAVGPSLNVTCLSETREAAKSHRNFLPQPGLAGWVGSEARQALEGEWAAGWITRSRNRGGGGGNGHGHTAQRHWEREWHLLLLLQSFLFERVENAPYT